MRTPPRPYLIAGIATLAVLALAGGLTLGYLLTRTGDITIRGTVQLSRGDFTWSSGAGCWGTGGYKDIREGASVTVTDATGATIAMGQLDQAEPDMDTPSTARACVLHFTVEDVPAGKGFYSVRVTHRDGPQYPEERLTEELHLTLG